MKSALFLYHKFAKPITLLFAFVALFLCCSTTAYAIHVSGATYGGQTGTATFGTVSSVTYTITLGETGAAAPVADGITLAWTTTPAGATWNFTSATEVPITGGTTLTPTFLPSGTNNSTITFTVTTSATTPAGTYPFTIKIKDNNTGGGGTFTSATINLVIGAAVAPTISYVGSPYTYYTGLGISSLTPTVTGSPTSYSISPALPTGLSFSTTTGVISGTPSAVTAAANYTITATNGGGNGTTTINIKVLASTFSYTGTPFTYYAGTAIATASPTLVGGTPSSYSVSPVLPTGLTLNTTNGQITGTPTSAVALGSYTITANYSSGPAATTSVNITVLSPTISYTGSPYTYTTGIAISSLTPAVTGTPSSYSISTPLPTGLSFNTSTGVISGTPTAISASTAYTITANYASGITATTAINITVNPPAPVISYTGSPFTYTTGIAISNLTPANTGGAATSWSISPALPAGLSFDTTTGIISGTPTATSTQTTYTITATNAGGSGITTIKITVNPPVPVISYSPSTNIYVELTAISALTPTNTGGAVATWSISPGLPLGLSFSTTTGVISGTPLAVSAMTTYTVTATNAGGSATTTVKLEVDLLAPTIVYTPATNTYTVAQAIATWTPTVLTGTPTSYSISPGLPAGLSFNTSTGAITGTPTATSPTTTYTVTASNAGGSGSTSITITCNNPAPPVISYTPIANIYTTGVAISTWTPSNTGGAVVSYSISPTLPAGLSFNTSTGAITGTPTVITTITSYTVTATNAGGTGSTSINITVNPPAPVISYTPASNTYVAGIAIATWTPNNTGGAAVTWSVSPALPTGLTFNTSTGAITGTPTVITASASYTVTATNAGGSGTTSITIVVNPPAPIISYTPVSNTYVVGTAITTWSPTNAGGAATTWSVSPSLPAGLTLNTTTGVITGTPTAVAATATYTVTATNVTGSGTATITITVNDIAPVISYTPSTNVYTVGVAITPLTPTNTGGAGTSWSIGPSLPAGLSFNSSTGVITGTPTGTSPVTTYSISADNSGGTSTAYITLSCVNPTPPVISYTPSSNTYITGTAITTWSPVNTGGAASSWTISPGLPAGLSFDATTGNITGTPTAISATASYTVTATNTAGSGTTSISITVNPTAPAISYSPASNTYSVGATITTWSPTNTGGPVTTWSISPGLPSGLSFDPATGNITGTPTATQASTSYTVTATNATGSSTASITISINSNGPVISYSPNTLSYSVGTTITPATPTNTGGASSSWSITAGGSFPAGLSLNASTGVISGTPTAVFATTTFTIQATNSSGSSTCTVIITVSPHAPIISYSPSTVALTLNAPMTTMTPNNTGGAVTGYSYSSTGVSLTGATLSGPSLMWIDASGNIYVANYNNGTVSRWNSAHTYLGTYTTGKTISNAEGIVFDSAGNCYVEDTGAGAIYKYGPTGAYLGTIVSGLSHPLGISIDPSNNLYIATYNYSSPYTSSVTKYSTAGVLLQTISNANMDESDGVAVDGAGNIYVLNRALDATGTNKGYVTKYNSAGVYQGIFSTGYQDPLAIACDPAGDVFVADSHNNQVKIYSSSGVLLNTIPGFNDVEGFVADGNGNLYVSDFTNNTVKEYAALGGYYISAPLPAGLSFNTSTGQITGTPTVTFAPTTYTITAYNITGSGTTTVTLSCIQSNDWIGTTSTDWNVSTNWLSNHVPIAGETAYIGVNRAFTNFPTVLTADGAVTVGTVQIGNLGGQAAGIAVQTGASLTITTLTVQSDASSSNAYTQTLSGAGTINVGSLNIISNTANAYAYTSILSSSISNLNVSGNIALTSSKPGSYTENSTFNVTGGTTTLTGYFQTTNTAGTTSTIAVTGGTLSLANATALSGLSATGTNSVTFNNTGATIQYSGAAQTVYTTNAITGLASGVNYYSIAFSGTGIKTVSSGNLNITGNFTNTMANDAGDYVNLSSPTVNFNGTTQTIAAGGGNGTTFYNVVFSGIGTKTIASGMMNVADIGTLTMSGTNAATILAANGNLTLNSDASGSASVLAMNGPGITGNVNVQRYVTGGAGYRGYRLTSSPVYTANVSGNNVTSINYIQNSVYLTGAAGGGFDKTGNPTIYLFREDQTPSNTTFISGNFWGVSAINNTPAYNYGVTGQSSSGTFNIPAGVGYLWFFRGNRASAALATETSTTYTTPVSATLTATGTLNQNHVVVSEWYTPGSTALNYTGSGTGTNFTVRGFNMVGNPYACSIDWEQLNNGSTTTGIYENNLSTTVYELNPATQNYDTYQKGGVYTNHGRRYLMSGEGFFVLATGSSNPQLMFNESAKTSAQLTGLNLFMSTPSQIAALGVPNVEPHIRLQMAMDTINKDDTYIGFPEGASANYSSIEDAPYKLGNGKLGLASFSNDHVRLAINKMSLPGATQTIIPLNISARAAGIYHLNLTEMQAVPKIYKIWLKDKFMKDSLDMRSDSSYAFNITTDTASQGANRFELVLRQDPALAVQLLQFEGVKTSQGSKLTWFTENEQNYTHFTLQRSTDGGKTFNVVGGVPSNGVGTYNLWDTAPLTSNQYRLQIQDLNGAITYSNIVTLMYANPNSLINNISLYPNPSKGQINLAITPPYGTSSTTNGNSPGGTIGSNLAAQPNANSTSYSIKIVNATGIIVKTATTTQTNWQNDVSNLLPGTYVLQVVDNNDKLVGERSFVKL